MMPVIIEDMEFKLSPGKHNEVQAAVMIHFNGDRFIGPR